MRKYSVWLTDEALDDDWFKIPHYVTHAGDAHQAIFSAIDSLSPDTSEEITAIVRNDETQEFRRAVCVNEGWRVNYMREVTLEALLKEVGE